MTLVTKFQDNNLIYKQNNKLYLNYKVKNETNTREIKDLNNNNIIEDHELMEELANHVESLDFLLKANLELSLYLKETNDLPAKAYKEKIDQKIYIKKNYLPIGEIKKECGTVIFTYSGNYKAKMGDIVYVLSDNNPPKVIAKLEASFPYFTQSKFKIININVPENQLIGKTVYISTNKNNGFVNDIYSFLQEANLLFQKENVTNKTQNVIDTIKNTTYGKEAATLRGIIENAITLNQEAISKAILSNEENEIKNIFAALAGNGDQFFLDKNIMILANGDIISNYSPSKEYGYTISLNKKTTMKINENTSGVFPKDTAIHIDSKYKASFGEYSLKIPENGAILIQTKTIKNKLAIDNINIQEGSYGKITGKVNTAQALSLLNGINLSLQENSNIEIDTSTGKIIKCTVGEDITLEIKHDNIKNRIIVKKGTELNFDNEGNLSSATLARNCEFKIDNHNTITLKKDTMINLHNNGQLYAGYCTENNKITNQDNKFDLKPDSRIYFHETGKVKELEFTNTLTFNILNNSFSGNGKIDYSYNGLLEEITFNKPVNAELLGQKDLPIEKIEYGKDKVNVTTDKHIPFTIKTAGSNNITILPDNILTFSNNGDFLGATRVAKIQGFKITDLININTTSELSLNYEDGLKAASSYYNHFGININDKINIKAQAIKKKYPGYEISLKDNNIEIVGQPQKIKVFDKNYYRSGVRLLEKDVLSIELAEDTNIILPGNIKTIAQKESTLEVYPTGKIKYAKFKNPTKITLKNGETALATEVGYDLQGNISSAKLEKRYFDLLDPTITLDNDLKVRGVKEFKYDENDNNKIYSFTKLDNYKLYYGKEKNEIEITTEKYRGNYNNYEYTREIIASSGKINFDSGMQLYYKKGIVDISNYGSGINDIKFYDDNPATLKLSDGNKLNISCINFFNNIPGYINLHDDNNYFKIGKNKDLVIDSKYNKRIDLSPTGYAKEITIKGNDFILPNGQVIDIKDDSVKLTFYDNGSLESIHLPKKIKITLAENTEITVNAILYFSKSGKIKSFCVPDSTTVTQKGQTINLAQVYYYSSKYYEVDEEGYIKTENN